MISARTRNAKTTFRFDILRENCKVYNGEKSLIFFAKGCVFMFKHGAERTVNVIISKGEDCGVIKESVDKLRNIVNNNIPII